MMWQSRMQLVVLTSTEQQLICAHFTGRYPTLVLQHYQKIPLPVGVVHNLCLCNPTWWRQQLVQFVTQAHLQLAPIALILVSDQLVETLNLEQRLDYKLAQLNLGLPVSVTPDQSQSISALHYRAGISAGVLLQYQLQFIVAQLSLAAITTKNGALLGLTSLPGFSWSGNLPELVQFDTAGSVPQLFHNQSSSQLTATAEQELLPSVGLYQAWSHP